MTYREMIEELQELSEEQLDMEVTVFLEGQDEYIAVDLIDATVGDDVLNDAHPILCISF